MQSQTRNADRVAQETLEISLFIWDSKLQQMGLDPCGEIREHTHAKGLKQANRAHNTPLILAMAPYSSNAQELAQKSDHELDGNFKRRLVHLTKFDGLDPKFVASI